MRHYLLTRSAYAPTVPLEENRRRLALLGGVCARSLAAQTDRDLTWIVLVDRDDPLIAERAAAVRSAGLPCATPFGALVRQGGMDKPYSPAWAASIDWSGGPILTTRIDDDDAFAPEAMAWVRAAAESVRPNSRLVWSLPSGWRIAGGLAERVTYPIPMFCTLQVPNRHRVVIYDASHLSARRLGPLHTVTNEPAWLWVRHDQTRSHQNMRQGFSIGGLGMEEPTRELVERFPIDWDLVTSLPQRGVVIPDRERR